MGRKNAIGTRSITVEDVDSVTRYGKTTYNKGKLNEYGNVVTYAYNGTLKPSYAGINGVSGILKNEHNVSFCWYDKVNEFHYVTDTDLKTKSIDIYNMLFGEEDNNKYWLASPCVIVISTCANFGVRCITGGLV